MTDEQPFQTPLASPSPVPRDGLNGELEGEVSARRATKDMVRTARERGLGVEASQIGRADMMKPTDRSAAGFKGETGDPPFAVVPSINQCRSLGGSFHLSFAEHPGRIPSMHYWLANAAPSAATTLPSTAR
jgi:hypothetical protein